MFSSPFISIKLNKINLLTSHVVMNTAIGAFALMLTDEYYIQYAWSLNFSTDGQFHNMFGINVPSMESDPMPYS